MVNFKRSVSMLIVAGVIVFVGILIITLARGYRFNIEGKNLKSSGILVANSAPDNAQIIVNDEFKGFTSENIYLPPGHYTVVIKKEGYSSWKKNFTIKGEVVSRVDSQLFSLNPSLSPLTNRGVINPYLSPTKEKVAYLVTPEEATYSLEETGGVFVAEISSKALSIFRQNSLLIPYSELPLGFSPEYTQFLFSTDEKNILVFLYDEDNTLLQVLMASTNGSKGQYFDATLSYVELINRFQEQQTQINNKILETFKKKVSKVLQDNTFVVELSPDKSKLLYFSLNNASLPRVITPPLIGSVPTKEHRNLVKGNFYVYDSKEDKNYLINFLSKKNKEEMLSKIIEITESEEITLEDMHFRNKMFEEIVWYSDSRHLIYAEDETISIIEYDGQNSTLVYSGPFNESFLASTTDGKLVTLTNINPKKNKYPDLYTISIK